MGDLMLTRFLSTRWERRRQIRGDLTSVDKRKDLKCQHDDNAQGCKGIGSGPCLPEVSQRVMKHSSVFEEHFHPRWMPENRHEKLKTAKISVFCSARSMMELTYHILENGPSLECLTLDTTGGAARCYLSKSAT